MFVVIEFVIVFGFGIVVMIVGMVLLVCVVWFNLGEIVLLGLLVGGFVLIVYVFWGWDSVFNVSEEIIIFL